MALHVAGQIRSFDPGANICIVTEPRFEDVRAHDVADVVVHCDDFYRAKIWGMTQSPWDRTMYIDADCEIWHEDIATVFQYLNDYDLVFTGLPEDRAYCFKVVHWNAGQFSLCGGVCLYDNTNPLVKQFLNEWYDLQLRAAHNEWWPLDEHGNPDYVNFPKDKLEYWDQFPLWWLTNCEPQYDSLKIALFEDDARWNYYSLYQDHLQHNEGEIVIYHHSSTANKDQAIY